MLTRPMIAHARLGPINSTHQFRRRRELTDDQKIELKEAFEIFDTNQSGRIDAKELKVVMKALGFDPTKEEIRGILNMVDKDGSGTISYEDYFSIMSSKVLERDPLEEIMKAYQLFADPNTGTISFQSLKRVSEELGEIISDEELHQMIAEADKDGDGFISENEFIRVMRKSNLF
ncbi:centrin, putative [Theileria equi strain WA]|uniref:Centrin, putative n=1 Tax=Theileria equi strain WA TaxID=1537102 RepID=L1L9Y8_THEEQ|nr:centrin, putative [Theileria equi strain WA]EKX71973.1 centrin, putative [Theileria equi strain WA]|eukprot:XP_004831425.1 centrin, putative [Theileria equi strain WA]